MKQFKMNLRNKKQDFLVCYHGTLDASLLGNILAGKGVIGAGDGAIAKAKSVSKEKRSKRQGKEQEQVVVIVL